jgi:hypothetical protein
MGVGPSKEKLLELIKTCSKSNKTHNNYKLEFQIDQENEICGGDEESLDDNYSVNSIYHKIKEVSRFPYAAIGTITLKFSGNDFSDHTCFLINKKVIVTLLSFLIRNKKKATEATTTFTEEKLNLKNFAKNEEKDLAVFFLEKKCSQWMGVDEYIIPRKNSDRKACQTKYGQIKIVFSRGKGTKGELDRSESNIFVNDRLSIGNNNKIIPFLYEMDYDGEKINKFINEKKSLREDIIGGVIYYKNPQNGGSYAIGIYNKNEEFSFFDRKTLQFLYEQVHNAKLSTTDGIDPKNIYELDLSKKNIGPSHIKMLTEFNLYNLKKLNLLKNQIGPQGAFHLSQSKFENLEVLILNFNEIGDEGVQHLSKGPFFGLKYLYLYHNNISNTGVEFILNSVFVDTLLLLDFSDNPNINSDGIDIFKKRIEENNNVLRELLALNLSATSMNDIALEKIKQITFPKLQKLILQDIDFSKSQKIKELKDSKLPYELKIS